MTLKSLFGPLALLVSLVAAAPVFAAEPAAKPVLIKPNKNHERCFVLDAGQKLEYRFSSANKLNFNLHYQKGGDQTYYPVKLDKTTGESGLFEAKARDKYCLYWENRTDADIELTYSYRDGK